GAVDTVLDPFVVAGATPAGYNGTYTGASAARVEDTNTVSYPLAGAIGSANTSVVVTASTASTTAVATVLAHGFATGDRVTVSGASPSQFSGTFTIASTPSA